MNNNETFINPVVKGDHADPTVLKDGDDYYATFSSFLSYPGIVIWHSRDLVNWKPIHTVLHKHIGSIWALDLVKHNNRYYIYIPTMDDNYSSTYVVYADFITGPWSEPIDLKVDAIDPGHAVGEDGKRYLFFNGIRKIQLSDDGLSTVGELEHAYDPWKYPTDWVVEMFAPEGPKIFRKGDYFYLVSAVGGTAGPATGHMVTVARSKSIHGPWIDCPSNPIIHTESDQEHWWSKGHASVVEGPKGDWWIMYHAYEKDFRTLGRQTLLEPIEWREDGWFYPVVDFPDQPIKMPIIIDGAEKFNLTDDFSKNRMGLQWSFFNAGTSDYPRAVYGDKSLVIKGKGSDFKDSAPYTCVAEDKSYVTEVNLTPKNGSTGGITLYYDERMYCGVGFDGKTMYTYNNGGEHSWMRESVDLETVTLRLENNRNVLTWYYSVNGGDFKKHPWQMEVSGMHHNVFGGFYSLKIGLFSFGNGSVEYKNFKYSIM